MSRPRVVAAMFGGRVVMVDLSTPCGEQRS
jgi:hypothetical protein